MLKIELFSSLHAVVQHEPVYSDIGNFVFNQRNTTKENTLIGKPIADIIWANVAMFTYAPFETKRRCINVIKTYYDDCDRFIKIEDDESFTVSFGVWEIKEILRNMSLIDVMDLYHKRHHKLIQEVIPISFWDTSGVRFFLEEVSTFRNLCFDPELTRRWYSALDTYYGRGHTYSLTRSDWIAQKLQQLKKV